MNSLRKSKYSTPVWLIWIATLISVVPGIVSADDNAIPTLFEIQKKIEKSVSDTMPAVVAISDGVGFGSGVVVDQNGLILTAGHVVNGGAKEFEIFFPSGNTVTARLIGYNLDVDSAMLQINEKGQYPFATLASADTLKKGDWVVCLGHSGGYELGRMPPVRTGRVLEFRNHLLVTDAALIGGDSGGPLFDLAGNVVGIHSSIGDMLSENRHVTIGTFRRDWTRLVRGEKWGKLPELPDDLDNDGEQRARMGIEMDESQNLPVIKKVNPDSPAARVGLKAGDKVIKFENVAMASSEQLIGMMRQKKVGDSVSIEIDRKGQLLKLVVILEQFK